MTKVTPEHLIVPVKGCNNCNEACRCEHVPSYREALRGTFIGNPPMRGNPGPDLRANNDIVDKLATQIDKNISLINPELDALTQSKLACRVLCHIIGDHCIHGRPGNPPAVDGAKPAWNKVGSKWDFGHLALHKSMKKHKTTLRIYYPCAKSLHLGISSCRCTGLDNRKEGGGSHDRKRTWKFVTMS